MSIGCGWRVIKQEPSDFDSHFIETWVLWLYARAHCVSRHIDPFPGNKKRCVPITLYWCNTQGCCPPLPSHQIFMTSNLHSLREKHTPHSVPAAVSGFAKKSAGAYQTEPRLPHEPIAASQTGFKTNQTAKQHRRKTLPLSVSPLLSQKWFTPPKNRVFLHGWFEEAQVCCVFRANVCAHEPEGIVETITLNSTMGKEWQFLFASQCFFSLGKLNELKGVFNIVRNVTKRLWKKKKLQSHG